MIDRILQITAPHYCFGCDKIGSVLCENCKYDIVLEQFSRCVLCRKPTNKAGVCDACHLPYSKAWVVGERSDILRRCLDEYKFNGCRAASDTFVELFDATIPVLPRSTIVVPIPTIAAHVRTRGYDHCQRISRGFAKTRQLPHQNLLGRNTHTVQRDAHSKQQRQDWAKQAFSIKRKCQDGPYLLIDDVMTTGFTLQYAAQALRDNGAADVYIAVVARQPLD